MYDQSGSGLHFVSLLLADDVLGRRGFVWLKPRLSDNVGISAVLDCDYVDTVSPLQLLSITTLNLNRL